MSRKAKTGNDLPTGSTWMQGNLQKGNLEGRAESLTSKRVKSLTASRRCSQAVSTSDELACELWKPVSGNAAGGRKEQGVLMERRKRKLKAEAISRS